jgi:anti-sigma regulatory factor (Ser/Thr protein kinase)
MQTTKDARWARLHLWLIVLYLAIASVMLLLSGAGHLRLLKEINTTFGGFFWAIDTDGQIVITSTPPQLPLFEPPTSPLLNRLHIVAVNTTAITRENDTALTHIYQNAHPGDAITYTITTGDKDNTAIVTRPVSTFTGEIWWQNYGSTLLAGLSWLVIGAILLITANEWTEAVEGMTLLPPALLFLLYSHWGNVQQAYPTDLVFQLLWIPAFALAGAAFLHLSLIYRPETLQTVHRLRIVDGIPYVPLLVLVSYELSSLLIAGQVPTSINLAASLGYGAFALVSGLCIGSFSLWRIGLIPPQKQLHKQQVPARIRQHIGKLLTVWIVGLGLSFCLEILPILLTGHALFALPTFTIAAAIFPLFLLSTIRSQRQLDRLHISLEQLEEEKQEQRQTSSKLQDANQRLEQATSVLLMADAHLRSLLSQRIHDQPRQQALRIRSLLGHWQHKLQVEAERDEESKVAAQPLIEVLGKVRKISEELESDLRGLQLLLEDAYQRSSLGLKLHLEKLIREDLPTRYPESPLKVQADLWALDAFSGDLEQTEEGAKIAETISYTVTQVLLNIYNHAGATFATVRTTYTNSILEITISDDGRGFDPERIPTEKTSLFKAKLKLREIGGTLLVQSSPRSRHSRGTTITLRIPPLPQQEKSTTSAQDTEAEMAAIERHHPQTQH